MHAILRLRMTRLHEAGRPAGIEAGVRAGAEAEIAAAAETRKM